MALNQFNRQNLNIRKLSERRNSLSLAGDQVPLDYKPSSLTGEASELIGKVSGKIIKAVSSNKPVIIAFGAHLIKNGMAPALIAMMREGWLTHLATNGAGIIHDWEFAYQGKTGEDVRENVREGKFGIWDETGYYLNLALITGAWEGLGYGESVGKMISSEGILIPDPGHLLGISRELMNSDPEKSAAAIDLAGVIKKYGIDPGFMKISHPCRSSSVQAAAYDLGIPFTGHPMFGHDIIYCHPMNHGAATGRCALRDFLSFAASISDLDDGVFISVGSSVMSPMIFEKAFSMAQNMKIQQGSHIDNHYILVVDLAESEWDWKKMGEPPADNPAYYLRYCKTFSRMGGEMDYLSLDNRDFIAALYHSLKSLQ